jgi:hypothetical protein
MNSERDINDPRYQSWRASVWSRDNGMCRICGSKGVEVHHIVAWSKDHSRRFDINNGITLCMACHEKTGSYYKPMGQAIQPAGKVYRSPIVKTKEPRSAARYGLNNKYLLLTTLYWVCFVSSVAIFIWIYRTEEYWLLILSVLLVGMGIWLWKVATKIKDSIDEINTISEHRADMKDCVLRLAQSYPTYTEYKNIADGFTINYPTDWKTYNPPDNSSMVFFSPKPEIFGYEWFGSLDIVKDYLLEDTLEQHVSADINSISVDHIKDSIYFKLCENKQLSSEKWHWYISYENEQRGYIFFNEKFYMQKMVSEDNENFYELYTIETNGFKDFYDAYRFQKIISSFNLIAEPSSGATS